MDDNDGGDKLTLAAIGAISDEEDDEDEKSEWNAEARALRQAIAEGKFNGLDLSRDDNVQKKEKTTAGKKKNESHKPDDKTRDVVGEQVALEDDSSEEEEDSNDQMSSSAMTSLEGNIKGLRSVTAHLLADKARMPWAENFGESSSSGYTLIIQSSNRIKSKFSNVILPSKLIFYDMLSP